MQFAPSDVGFALMFVREDFKGVCLRSWQLAVAGVFEFLGSLPKKPEGHLVEVIERADRPGGLLMQSGCRRRVQHALLLEGADTEHGAWII